MNAATLSAFLRRAIGFAASLLLLAGSATAQDGNVAINATGAAAQPTALLDVSSVTQGIFLPRMGNLPAPAALPDGLTVYKTGAAPGFYVVDNGQWVSLNPGNNFWDIFGNYLTDPTYTNPDYIGTTGADMNFRTFSMPRMHLEGGTGFLGVGYPAAPTPAERLDINGAMRIYFEYWLQSPSINASKGDDPGTIRYQPYGTTAGSGQYQYGNHETEATAPSSTAVNNAVLGIPYSYPLQYAGHWGNVDGTPLVQGKTTPPPLVQPSLGGWRSFENPYIEEFDKNWTHFKDAECGPGDAQLPEDVPIVWCNSAFVPAGEQRFVSPFPTTPVPSLVARRQYLFRAGELNMEEAQAGGNAIAEEGLCAGEPITSIAFYVDSRLLRGVATPNASNLTVTVRHAPPGLNSLIGFDNAPNFGVMSCSGTFATWPTVPVSTLNWQTVALSPPFVWDGVSNVLIEVAFKSAFGGGTGMGFNPVWCTDAGFDATFGADVGPAIGFNPVPVPNPPASCDANTNPAVRMPDSDLNTTYISTSSHWRPVVRFSGTVAKVATPAPVLAGSNGIYLTHPSLVLEDPSTAVNGIPWGRWRPGIPAGNNSWSFQGMGTISAQFGVYDNSVALNDHVFDRAFDGRVAPTDAAQFGNRRTLDITEMASFTKEHRHLPTMKGRKAWNVENGFSLGDLGNQLWATTETQALYIADLHDQLNVIEMLSSNRPLTANEFFTARQGLASMATYTDAEKARLIADLRQRTTFPAPSP